MNFINLFHEQANSIMLRKGIFSFLENIAFLTIHTIRERPITISLFDFESPIDSTICNLEEAIKEGRKESWVLRES